MTLASGAGRPGVSITGRRWNFAPVDPAEGRALAAALGVSPAVGQILVARGVSTAPEARAFLFGGREALFDPFLLPDMERAVAHLREAIGAGQKIWIYGDYDVDGVAATALLYRVLAALGAAVEAYIPSRFDEGYGLNRVALEELARAGAHTVVTVDCGVTALAEAAYARELGLHLVITDHHEPLPERPNAIAVIDPKLPGSSYPFAGLSGTGVAFKLGLALAGEEHADLVWRLADLVALATVADMVPLQGENRVLVKEGLARLNGRPGPLPGLAALAKIAGVKPGELTEFHLAFALAPRINALGRLGSAREALDLLLAEDEQQVTDMAQRLDEENRRRQAIEADIYKEALVQAQLQADEGRRVLVLASPGWHIGVVGIVASRVTERFHRPTLMIGIEGEEGRGSGRSLPGFHLFAALTQCEDLLLRFGGHSQAAGFSLRADQVATLAERLEQIAATDMQGEDLGPELRIDGEAQAEEMTEETARQIGLLAPFGFGNPSPMLVFRDVTITELRPVGKEGTHLKLRLRAGRRTLDAIAFGLTEAATAAGVMVGHQADVAGVPELNEWNGRLRVQLKVRDLGQPLVAAAALAQTLAEAAPEPPAGAHYLWAQALPRLAGSGEWPPWEQAAAGAAEAPTAARASGPALPSGDLRLGADPVATLLDLARRGVPTIAVAATPARALQLAAQAAQQEPHLATSFLPYHGRLPAAVRALALAEFRQRNAPVLLTGWGGFGGLEPGLAETVVLLDPPLSAVGYRHAAGLAAAAALPVWHWSPSGVALTADLVAAHCPDRQELAALYLFLKDLARAGRPITVAASLASGLPRATVLVGLQVLTELGLLAAGSPEGAAEWAWLPAGKGRLALESSAVFRDRQARRQEFQQLLGYFSKVGPTLQGRQVI
ncbi:MAG: single-stranded-DNA-specific exonuclease RecJ [Symbiobacteriia bacterium]